MRAPFLCFAARLCLLPAPRLAQDIFLASDRRAGGPQPADKRLVIDGGFSTAAGVNVSGLAFRAQWSEEAGEAVVKLPPSQEVKASLPAHCELAVVGAAWGGAYVAWRLTVDAGVVPASSVCIFEASGRIGGRIYSVHDLPGLEGVVLDVGGYRFSDAQKLPAQLIWDGLRIPSKCYDWRCRGTCEVGGVCHVIQDAYGNNAGYATPIQTMLGQVEDAGEGTQVFFGKQLLGIYGAENSTAAKLVFQDSTSVTASRVVLNLPHNALANLDQASVLFQDAPPPTQYFLDRVVTNFMNKVYAVYEDAWWNSKLGLMEGFISSITKKAPMSGRYHDGPQKCIIGQDPVGRPIYSGHRVRFGNCSGALEVYYSEGEPYYRQFMRNPLQPLTVLGPGSELVEDVHAHLMRYHAKNFSSLGIDPATIAKPVRVVVANWIVDGAFTPGIGFFLGSDSDRAQVRTPTPDYKIHVVNQDYGYQAGWAVGSLITAEKVLQADIGVKKPAWLDDAWYQENVVGRP